MKLPTVSNDAHADGNGDFVASRHEMGVRAVGAALRRARGRLSQQAAAEQWNVPLATMAALEQGVLRDYQSQTLAQFDEMLGQSTLDLYERPDEAPPISTMDDLTRTFVELSDELADRISERLHASLDQTSPFVEVAELWDSMPAGVRLALTLLMREIAVGRNAGD